MYRYTNHIFSTNTWYGYVPGNNNAQKLRKCSCTSNNVNQGNGDVGAAAVGTSGGGGGVGGGGGGGGGSGDGGSGGDLRTGVLICRRLRRVSVASRFG